MVTKTEELNPSEEIIGFLRGKESFRDTAYPDSGGKWTIGWGSTIVDGKPVKPGQKITKEKAEKQFRNDISVASNDIKKPVNFPINQKQLDALTSFRYNTGPTQWQTSTLRKKLNAGDIEGAAKEFPRWVHDDKKQKQEGLVTRRNHEKSLFLGTGNFVASGKVAGYPTMSVQDSAGVPEVQIAQAPKKKEIIPQPKIASIDSGGGLPQPIPTEQQAQLPQPDTTIAQRSPLDVIKQAALSPVNAFVQPAQAQEETQLPTGPQEEIRRSLPQLPLFGQSPEQSSAPSTLGSLGLPLEEERSVLRNTIPPVAMPPDRTETSLDFGVPDAIIQGAKQGVIDIGASAFNLLKTLPSEAGRMLGGQGIPAADPRNVPLRDGQTFEDLRKQHPIAAAAGEIAVKGIGAYEATWALSKLLPIPPIAKPFVLGGVWALENIGEQLGRKEGLQREVGIDKPLGIEGFMPDNPSEAISTGVLSAAGPLLGPTIKGG